MAGSLDIDKRPVVNSGGILYSSTSMNTNKRGGHEPPDVFCGLASLIVEGRVPRTEGGKDGRGVHHEEGPHALKHYGPSGNQLHGHVCSSDNFVCKKDENFRKHMLLLWQNNVPVSIEVLLCSDCRVGRQKANSFEYSTIPEPGSILLEQWTVSISNNFKLKEQKTIANNINPITNVDRSTITARGLFQAVRSYLHFSQLSAWYDSFRGTVPNSVLYRITIPGETFASKFTCQPEQHYFPPAAVGPMALVNVAVRSYPRTDKIPKVICTHNNTDSTTNSASGLVSITEDILPSDSSSTSASPTSSKNTNVVDQLTNSKQFSEGISTNVEDNKLSMAGALSWKETERLETDLRRMTLVKNKMTECTLSNTNLGNTALPRSDSMDSMLGDSLLDPPQDLQKMPPKRYQSPSRCGSPSVEAPDHLLFRNHYNTKENNSKGFQAYKTGEFGTNNSESASNRLARQDLLRRRDIGQTPGISGSCHGLHPRLLLSIGPQPRLSLPPKSNVAIASPVISTNGPYRAFPPERCMHQFLPLIQKNPYDYHVSEKDDKVIEDMDDLSQLVGKMEVKCNISGKHICKYETLIKEHVNCSNTGNLANDSFIRDKQVQCLEGFTLSDNSKKEKDSKQGSPPSALDSTRSKTKSTASFTLGGAKKKSAIPINEVNKKYDKTRSPALKRRHYKEIESDDDTGMEVAEYDIVDIKNTSPLRSSTKTYKGRNEKTDEREVVFQRELDEILDGLAPKKDICTSRRSSLKDEDQLFPHKCQCKNGSSKNKIGYLDETIHKDSFYKPPIITQVYRTETEAPSLLSSPSLLVKSGKTPAKRPSSPAPTNALNKADILLGAILRTCERNKHLETEEESTIESGSSSRGDDSYSLGVNRKTPEERKNSAGDADDEDEGNTSSDNESSILSSPTSSDEEDGNIEHSTHSSNSLYYKPKSKGITNKLRQNRIYSATRRQNLSDTSSSQCSSCNVIPSNKSSVVLPPRSLDHFQTDQISPTDYAKTQTFCDTKNTRLSSQDISINRDRKWESYTCETPAVNDEIVKDNEHVGSDSYNLEAQTESGVKLYSDSSDYDFSTAHQVETKSHKRQDIDEYKGKLDLEQRRSNYLQKNNCAGLARLRTMSEAIHKSPLDDIFKKEPELSTRDTTNSDDHVYSNGTYIESLDTDTWFDHNYGKDYTIGISNGYECDQEINECDSKTPSIEDENRFVFDDNNKSGHDVPHFNEELVSNASNLNNGISIPTMVQKDYFRQTLNSATSMVFHRKTGLPLSSSPAPLRRGKNDFGFDSAINTPTAIKRAFYPALNPKDGCSNAKKSQIPAKHLELNSNNKEDGSQEMEEAETEGTANYCSDTASICENGQKRQDKGANDDHIFRNKRHCSSKSTRLLSVSAPAAVSSQGTTANNLLGTFEESVLNGRLEPVSTVEGFSAEIGASGSFHPKHKTVPVNVFFYNMCCDNSPSISSPYLGHINLGKKGYRVPQTGTIQVTLFNPLGTVVKMFVVMYDLTDMPPNSQTFIRQRTFYMPTSDSISENDRYAIDNQREGSFPVGASPKWLRYLVHLRFASSKSGKIYLHTDIRMIIFRKSDLDTAADHNTTPGNLGGFELRSFTNGPSNPKFSPRKINFRQEE